MVNKREEDFVALIIAGLVGALASKWLDIIGGSAAFQDCGVGSVISTGTIGPGRWCFVYYGAMYLFILVMSCLIIMMIVRQAVASWSWIDRFAEERIRNLLAKSASLPVPVCRVCRKPMALMDRDKQKWYCYKDDKVYWAKRQR
jgi:hypothetical protein